MGSDALTFLGDSVSQHVSWASASSILSVLLLRCSLSSRCSSCAADGSGEAGLHTAPCCLLIDCGVRLLPRPVHSPVGGSIQNILRNYVDLVR